MLTHLAPDTVGPARPRDGGPRRIDRAGLVALIAGLCGVAYRAILLCLGAPTSDSDESTFGIAAIRIAHGQGHPLMYYGQGYMGALEAYLAAPLVRLAGPSLVATRTPTLLCYAASLVLAYRLTRRLYSPWLGAFTVVLLAFGSQRVLQYQLNTYGGRAEGRPLALTLMLLSVALAGDRRTRWHRYGFAAWGFLAGLSLWLDWVLLPYVAAAGLLLAVGCWRRLLRLDGLVLAASAAVGTLPLIVYNLRAAPGMDSLTWYHLLRDPGHASLYTHVFGPVVEGIPLIFGLCPPQDTCSTPTLFWGPACCLLLLISGAMAIWAAWHGPSAERHRHLARLALVLAALLTVVGCVDGETFVDPYNACRYFSYLLVSLPAVVWPLWRAAQLLDNRFVPPLRRVGAALAGVALAALLSFALYATAALVAFVPHYRAADAQQNRLITALTAHRVRAMYTDYWTCNRIAFATGLRVVCWSVSDTLGPGVNRVPWFHSQVRATPDPAYVFPESSTVDDAFARYTGVKPSLRAGGYDIYLGLPAGLVG